MEIKKMAKSDKPASVSLLFKKRKPVDRAIATQYVGTTTELDIK